MLQSLQSAAASAGPGWWLAAFGCFTALLVTAAAGLVLLAIRPLLKVCCLRSAHTGPSAR